MKICLAFKYLVYLTCLLSWNILFHSMPMASGKASYVKVKLAISCICWPTIINIKDLDAYPVNRQMGKKILVSPYKSLVLKWKNVLITYL